MPPVVEVPFTPEELLLRELALQYEGHLNQKSVRIYFQGHQLLVTVKKVS